MADVNDRYYARVLDGRTDYWRKMAAPRFRVETLVAELRREPPRALVDLGCGNGELLAEISRRLPGVALAGVDLSAEQIAANRESLPAVDWHVRDLDDETPLPESLLGRFGAVIAAEVIEHVAAPERLLLNARRLAASGGRLLLSTQSGRIHETERRVGHLRHFTQEGMRALLAATGWTPERVWNSGYPFHDWSKRAANWAPDATMREFSGRPYGWSQNAVCFALRAAFRLNSQSRGAQLFAVARKNS